MFLCYSNTGNENTSPATAFLPKRLAEGEEVTLEQGRVAREGKEGVKGTPEEVVWLIRARECPVSLWGQRALTGPGASGPMGAWGLGLSVNHLAAGGRRAAGRRGRADLQASSLGRSLGFYLSTPVSISQHAV